MADPTWDSTAPIQVNPQQDSAPTWDNTVDTEEKYGNPLEQAKAGVEGIARGATFGGSDIAETKLGISTPENIKGRMEENPVTSTVGQMAGSIAPIAATGGAAAPAEALLGPGTTAARIAAMGLEGAAFGGSNAVTDYALGDPNLNAQKIVSDIGMGAALGGGLGILSKGIEAAVPAATEALNKGLSSLTSKIEGLPEKYSGDWAQTLAQGMKNTDPDVAVRKMSDTLGDIYSSSKSAAKDIYEKTLPSNLKESLVQVPLEQAQQKALDVYSQLEAKIQDLRANPDEFSPIQVKQAQKAVSDLQNNLVKSNDSYEIHSALHDFAKDISTGIKYDTLPTFQQQAVQGEMRGMNGIVRGLLKDPETFGPEAAEHFSQVSDLYNNHATTLKNFQRDFMKSVATSTGGKRAVIDPGKVKTFFNNIDEVGQDLRNTHFNDFLNSAQNLSKASENYAGFNAATDTISNRVSKLAQEYSELKGVAKAMASRTSPSKGRFSEVLGAGVASAAGVPHPVVAGAIGAMEALKAIRNPYELGSTINNVFNKIRAIGKITERTGKAVSSGTKAIFSGSTRGAIQNASISSNNYDKNVSRLNELTQSPETMMNHLNSTTSAMYDAAPNISNGIHSTMMNGVNFLASKIPKPVTNYPMGQEFEPNETQKDTFNQYFNTVNNPVGVLTSIKDGEINNHQIEALQAVYPHLLQEMRSEMISQIQSPKAKDIDYSVKMSIAKFLGQPLDANMTVPAIMSNQTVFVPQQPPQAPGKPGKSPLGGLKELDVASRSSTGTQELEEEPA